MMELTHYLTADGHDPFQAWLDATKAKDRPRWAGALVMLLIGGTKKRQQADIEQAKAFLADHRRRTQR